MQQYPYIARENQLGPYSTNGQYCQGLNYTRPTTPAPYHYQHSDPRIIPAQTSHEYSSTYTFPVPKNTAAPTYQNGQHPVAYGNISNNSVEQSNRDILVQVSQRPPLQQAIRGQQTTTGPGLRAPMRMTNPYHNVARQMGNMTINEHDQRPYNTNISGFQNQTELTSVPSVAVMSPQERGRSFGNRQESNTISYSSNEYLPTSVNSFSYRVPNLYEDSTLGTNNTNAGMSVQNVPYQHSSEIRHNPSTPSYSYLSNTPNNTSDIRANSSYSRADGSTTWAPSSQYAPASQVQVRELSSQTRTTHLDQNAPGTSAQFPPKPNPNAYLPTQNATIEQQNTNVPPGYPMVSQSYPQPHIQHETSRQQVSYISQCQAAGNDGVATNTYARNENFPRPEELTAGRPQRSDFNNREATPAQQDVRLTPSNEPHYAISQTRFHDQPRQNGGGSQHHYQPNQSVYRHPTQSVYRHPNPQAASYNYSAQTNYSEPPIVRYPALYVNDMVRDQNKVTMGNFNQVPTNERPPLQMPGEINNSARMPNQHHQSHSAVNQRYPVPGVYPREAPYRNQGDITQQPNSDRHNSFQRQNEADPAMLGHRGSQEYNNQNSPNNQGTYHSAGYRPSAVNQGQASQPYPNATQSLANEHMTAVNSRPTYHSQASIDNKPVQPSPTNLPYNVAPRFASGPGQYVQRPVFDTRNRTDSDPQNMVSYPNDQYRTSIENKPPGPGFNQYHGGRMPSQMPSQMPNQMPSQMPSQMPGRMPTSVSTPTYPQDYARAREFQQQENRISNINRQMGTMPGSPGQPIVIMPGPHAECYPSNHAAQQYQQQEMFVSKIESILNRIRPQLNNGLEFTKFKKVADDIENLEDDVLKFNGRRGDREYIYIEEMLTRQLLTLDQILAEGNEEVRILRKSLVKEVQGLLLVLERRAKV